MPKKSKSSLTPKQKARAIAMRSAGYTYAAICEKTGVSLSSQKRLYATEKVVPGDLFDDVVREQREDLIKAMGGDVELTRELARIRAEELRLSELLRHRLFEILEELKLSSDKDAAEVARTLAAISTAMKNSSDHFRKAINASRLENVVEPEQLPQLVVRAMTDAEVQEIRDQQAEELEDVLDLY